MGTEFSDRIPKGRGRYPDPLGGRSSGTHPVRTPAGRVAVSGRAPGPLVTITLCGERIGPGDPWDFGRRDGLGEPPAVVAVYHAAVQLSNGWGEGQFGGRLKRHGLRGGGCGDLDGEIDYLG